MTCKDDTKLSKARVNYVSQFTTFYPIPIHRVSDLLFPAVRFELG